MSCVVNDGMCKLGFAVAWACLVGISVPLEVCNASLLNRHSPEKDRSWHSVYIAELAVAMGGLQLAVLSFASKAPWTWPSPWWSYFGGVCSLPGYITISAAQVLGVEMLLMTQLVGLLGTFFVLDLADGTIRLGNWPKPVGLFFVVIGVVVDKLLASSGDGAKAIDINWIVHVVGAFCSGVGFALQAKCNGALAHCIGGPARAAMICAVVNVLASSPLSVYIRFGMEVPLSLDSKIWPMWFAAGFQSAFYVSSMALLPRFLGFTTCYLAVLSSKLFCSAVVDATGLTGGSRVALSAERILSIFVVLFGATLFQGRCGSTHAKAWSVLRDLQEPRAVDPASEGSTETPPQLLGAACHTPSVCVPCDEAD
mmetsp:Transcript_87413/g.245379  ORF Transcript_87413/g.245379 Transcript_87413/m.245379 type:complete len:368 (+) Transcript_87413:153-1256(+)